MWIFDSLNCVQVRSETNGMKKQRAEWIRLQNCCVDLTEGKIYFVVFERKMYCLERFGKAG